MANILNILPPSLGNSNNDLTSKNAGATNLAMDPTIKNPVDVNNVVRADQKNQSENNTQQREKLAPDSNYATFLKGVKGYADLSSVMTRLFYVGLANIVETGIRENFAAEISNFLNMSKMSPEELTAFIKEQLSSSSKFTGILFDTLRQGIYYSDTPEIRTQILELVRALDNMNSGKHILESMKQELNNIGDGMFKTQRQTLEEAVQKMDFKAQIGDVEHNSQVLKQEIVPILKAYIKQTGDTGMIRDQISLLTYNIARYESGGIDRASLIFRRLMGHKPLAELFEKNFQSLDWKDMNIADFLKAYSSKVEGEELRKWSDSFLNIMEKSIKGEAGNETKQVFENIMSSILINQSVYMPLLHLMVPVEIYDTKLYSEMWIDPDCNGDGVDAEKRKSRLLIKFDIEDVGFFDLIVDYSNHNVDVALMYPENLKKMEGEFRKGLMDILRKHELNYSSVSLQKSVAPVTISEVFPKIYERRNAVNVRV